MKIVSWNVAGLRACLKKGFADFFFKEDADIYCLQESKATIDQYDFHPEGWHEYLNAAERKGYSGTLIYTKIEPIQVTYGIGNSIFDSEGRAITLEFEQFYLVNFYVPNVKRTLERMDERLVWEQLVRKYLKKLDKVKPVVICGDFNVAHQEIDICNAKANRGNAGFTDQERENFGLLLDCGFIDSFRYYHPELTGAYTWWSYIGNCRERNIGWRIDYFLVSARFIHQVTDTMIYSDVYGSDHCPIGIELSLLEDASSNQSLNQVTVASDLPPKGNENNPAAKTSQLSITVQSGKKVKSAKKVTIHYPEFIHGGDTVGIVAPSDGVVAEEDIIRLDRAIQKFKQLNLSVVEAEHVRCTDGKGKSCASPIQAEEFLTMWNNDEIKAIFCVSGGDFLLEMLSYLDEKKLSSSVKWVQGYSDPTGILFYLTTKFRIATLYANNFKAFGMEEWHESLESNLAILKGNLHVQKSFSFYDSGSHDDPLATGDYFLDTPVVWKRLFEDQAIKVRGRLLGGCLDVLVSMIGTRFDCVKEFLQDFREDGIIWYFDNCELSSESLIRALWQLKEAGWFKETRAILFGRSMTNRSYYGISFEQALEQILQELNVPVLWDIDVGHIPPRMTFINGAIIEVIYDGNGKGSIEFFLE